MDNGASSYRRFRDEGDENGLIEIIKEYRDGLIYYLFSIVGDFHIAEELCEDVFVLLGTKKPRDSGKSSFKTWLYTIGRNRAFNYLKWRKRNQTISLEEVAEAIASNATMEDALLTEESNKILYQAMRQLKPEYRQILLLVYFESFSLKDAALVMKKTVHSIETLVYRARKSLKLQLEMEGYEYEKL